MYRIGYVLAALVLMLGCQTTTTPSSGDESLPFVIEAEQLVEMLASPTENDVVVLHVGRDRTAYDASHIPGAHFLPLRAVATNRDSLVNVLPDLETLQASLQAVGISASTHVVLYGDMGGLAAGRAFFALDATGHRRTFVLNGGLAAWQRTQQPVTTDVPPTPEPGTFVPVLNADRVTTVTAVHANLDAPEPLVVLDARPIDQHTGATPGTDVQRPGHIPASVSAFWKDDLQANGALRPLSELRARYADLGLQDNQRVITYCRTGVQASHAYFVMRMLGYEPMLYDGAYLEWSNNTAHPVIQGE